MPPFSDPVPRRLRIGNMRSFVSKLLITCLLAASSSLALGPPAPPPGFGQPPPGHVDSLASGHWSPTPPGVRASKWQPPSWGPPPGAGVGAGNWLPPPPGSAMPGAPGGPPVSQEPSTVKTVGQSELQLEQGFPGEPTRASMYTYVPTTFQKGNPLVVALHHCGGTATGYFRENPDWVKMADQKGFMMVFASSPGGTGGCWDVSSKSSLKHNGGGDSQSIANMITYAQKKYGCSKQVYVVGHSSGAMLTQVMGATYPDLILAGAAYSGVPAGCLRTEKAQGADWNSEYFDNDSYQHSISEPQLTSADGSSR